MFSFSQTLFHSCITISHRQLLKSFFLNTNYVDRTKLYYSLFNKTLPNPVNKCTGWQGFMKGAILEKTCDQNRLLFWQIQNVRFNYNVNMYIMYNIYTFFYNYTENSTTTKKFLYVHNYMRRKK